MVWKIKVSKLNRSVVAGVRAQDVVGKWDSINQMEESVRINYAIYKVTNNEHSQLKSKRKDMSQFEVLNEEEMLWRDVSYFVVAT